MCFESYGDDSKWLSKGHAGTSIFQVDCILCYIILQQQNIDTKVKIGYHV